MNVLGKVDLCQVGVFLAFATETLWTWIDGELFLPEPWFAAELADERTRLGIPPGRQFATKVEVGWQMIERVLAAGVPFEVLLCDDVYGRSQWLRHHLRHHLALMILAGWFITQTKVEWALQHSRDGRLADELGWAACQRSRWRMCASCCKR
jgi:SRSO17 transposase